MQVYITLYKFIIFICLKFDHSLKKRVSYVPQGVKIINQPYMYSTKDVLHHGRFSTQRRYMYCDGMCI